MLKTLTRHFALSIGTVFLVTGLLIIFAPSLAKAVCPVDPPCTICIETTYCQSGLPTCCDHCCYVSRQSLAC
jgi:hypothetical protein